MRNDSLQFRCVPSWLRIENADTMFSSSGREGQVLMVPISHGEGNYQADPQTIATLEASRRVVFRYVTPNGEATAEGNPNGSLNNIAGIINERGNVLGMMPHPERAGEALVGGTDGLVIFRSMIESAVAAVA
jgi:phosphoribosylformylglycinamidine synthase